MLELKNISKVYKVGTFGGKELHAVKNVSFEIKKGEVVSLIGESGSGKSTIGKMILRLIPISAGTIIVNEVDISSLKGSQVKDYYRQVQGVFQDPFSTYNPIFKADRIFRVIKDEFFPQMNSQEWHNKLNSSLEAVGLNPEHVSNKFPHQLSGGQLQRLLIARALLLDSQFLVADEIISMLDASTRIDVLNLLGDLKSRGLSILFVTHDLSLGYYISDKTVILHQGSVVEMGATERIFDNPLHPYTKMLMASVPRLDKKWAEIELEVAPAAKPSLLPDGWVYYDNHSPAHKNGIHPGARPMLLNVEPDHFVACFKTP